MIIVLYYNVLYIYVTKNKSTRPPFSAGCQGKCDHLWKSHQLREGLAVCFWSLELHGAKLPEEESHLFHGSLGNWWKLDVWDSKIEGLEIVESLSSGFFFLAWCRCWDLTRAPVTSRLQQCHQCLWVVGDMETSGWSSVKWQVHLVIPPTLW